MKTKIISILLAGFFLVSAVRAQPVSVSIGYQSFYDELSPYGTWVNYPGYGYVWKYRNSNMSFRPYYSRGHWVFTEYGWTWASDYSWGWATFHYGRWFYDDYMGWLWIPGNEWAPAWVTWGSYNNDFCWAPIGPNIDISVNAGYRPPANYWSACPGAYFGRSDWYGYGVNISHNTTIVNNITIIRNNNNSVRYSRGPEAGAVEKYTRTRSAAPLLLRIITGLALINSPITGLLFIARQFNRQMPVVPRQNILKTLINTGRSTSRLRGLNPTVHHQTPEPGLQIHLPIRLPPTGHPTHP